MVAAHTAQQQQQTFLSYQQETELVERTGGDTEHSCSSLAKSYRQGVVTR